MAGIVDLLLSAINRNVALPTNAKVYIESVIDKNRDPITGETFSERELQVIRDLVAESVQTRPERGRELPATPGYVNYQTYRKEIPSAAHVGGRRFSIHPPASPAAMFTPEGRVATTLGQFNYRLADDGSIEVYDTYDFNAMDSGGQKTVGTQYLEMPSGERIPLGIASLGYFPLRARGQETLPDGTGRPVSVVLPKDQFSDAQYEALFKYLKEE
jgi:hypothetical protein